MKANKRAKESQAKQLTIHAVNLALEFNLGT